ncbi:hypothetical protein ACS51_02140 [Bacillus cereus]|nr:hypothetical protein ACS51_02140 [Bacillus cereus]
MKLKKCGFLFSLVMVVCFAIPSFAKAESKNIISGKKFYNDFSFKEVSSYTEKINDGDFFTSDYSRNVMYADLGGIFDISKFVVKGSTGSASDTVFYFQLYDENKQMIYKSRVYSYSYNKGEIRTDFNNISVGNIRYVSLHGGSKLYEFELYGEKGTPKIDKLTHNVSGESVTFKWLNPNDTKFVGVDVYQGTKLLSSLDSKKDTYTVSELESGKNYDFRFDSFYLENGKKTKSGSIEQKVKIPYPVLPPPDEVTLKVQNGSLVVSWNKVNSPHSSGYNIYVDGKKVNDSPVSSEKLHVTGLENGREYKIQVSTVNKGGVEGEKSKGLSDSPSDSAITTEYDVKMPFSPLDLVTSSFSLLALLGGFILLSIAIIWFKPLKELIVKAVRREKDKK